MLEGFTTLTKAVRRTWQMAHEDWRACWLEIFEQLAYCGA
jgi:hypothetical protein